MEALKSWLAAEIEIYLNLLAATTDAQQRRQYLASLATLRRLLNDVIAIAEKSG